MRVFPAALLPLSLGGCPLAPTLTGNGVPGERHEALPDVQVVVAAGALQVDVQPSPKAAARVRCDENLLPSIRLDVDGGRLVIHTAGPAGGAVQLAPQAGPCTVWVGLPALHAVSNTGSGDLRVGGEALDAPETGPLTRAAEAADGGGAASDGWDTLAAATLTGSGALWLAGSSSPEALTLTLTGSGDLFADAVAAKHLEATLTGSGDLWVEGGRAATIDARLSGSGDLDLRAAAAPAATLRLTGSGDLSATVSDTVEVTLSGSGDVRVWGDPRQRARSRTGSGKIRFEQ